MSHMLYGAKMISLPTTEQANINKYWSIVRKLEPEFYMVRIALKETGINPLLLNPIVRAISNLAQGTGSGKIQIFMEKKKVTVIKGEETVYIQEEAVIDSGS